MQQTVIVFGTRIGIGDFHAQVYKDTHDEAVGIVNEMANCLSSVTLMYSREKRLAFLVVEFHREVATFNWMEWIRRGKLLWFVHMENPKLWTEAMPQDATAVR